MRERLELFDGLICLNGGKRRSCESINILERTPVIDVPEGFVFRDTEDCVRDFIENRWLLGTITYNTTYEEDEFEIKRLTFRGKVKLQELKEKIEGAQSTT